jgi:hypothetical protein
LQDDDDDDDDDDGGGGGGGILTFQPRGFAPIGENNTMLASGS